MKNIPCTRDDVFKSLLCESSQMRELIVSNLCHLNNMSLEIINPNILPDKSSKKTTYLDTKLKTGEGHLIGIEMQTSSLTIKEIIRFQFYLSQMIVSQLKRGKKYETLKPCFEIVFSTKKNKSKALIQRFTLRKKNGQEMTLNLMNMIIVNIPNIRYKVEKKGIDGLNSFEKMIYALNYNLNDDILNTRESVVLEMNEIKASYTLSEEAREWEEMKERYFEFERRQEIREKEEALKKQMMKREKAYNQQMMRKEKAYNQQMMRKEKAYNQQMMRKEKAYNQQMMRKEKAYNQQIQKYKEAYEQERKQAEVKHQKFVEDTRKKMIEKIVSQFGISYEEAESLVGLTLE